MKRNKYYPERISARPEWHANLAAKLPIYGPTLGLTAQQIANAVADNLWLAYGLGEWKTNLYESGPSGTAAPCIRSAYGSWYRFSVGGRW